MIICSYYRFTICFESIMCADDQAPNMLTQISGQRSSNQMIQLELYHGFIGTYALAASSKAAGTFAANVIYRLKKMADFKNPFNQVGK